MMGCSRKTWIIAIAASALAAGTVQSTDEPSLDRSRTTLVHLKGQAPVYALQDVVRTEERIVPELALQTYAPTHEVLLYAEAGDLLRMAGQVEGTEQDYQRNKMWAWLSIRPSTGPPDRTRVSSYGWQAIIRDNNHHMPIHLYGSYEVVSSGNYIVEIMSRRTGSSTVAVEKALRDEFGNLCDSTVCNCPGCAGNPVVHASQFGQIIVEQYRPFQSVEAAVSAGATLVTRTERAPLLADDISVVGTTAVDFQSTDVFELQQGDVLRTQGLATSQFVAGNNLFPLEMRLSGDVGTRLSISTENIVNVLFRFSLQNDGFYQAPGPRSVWAFQRTYGLPDDPHDFLVRGADLVAMQFSNDPAGAFLADSVTMKTSSDLQFDTSGPLVEVFSFGGNHQAGDILRAQGQLQLEMTSGSVGASCWARITIDVNGVGKYLSVFDQRFIRNSSSPEDDHDAGAFAPFALYRTTEPGAHLVRLTTDCAATSSATMFAKYYGRHLTVDRFAVEQAFFADGFESGATSAWTLTVP